MDADEMLGRVVAAAVAGNPNELMRRAQALAIHLDEGGDHPLGDRFGELEPGPAFRLLIQLGNDSMRTPQDVEGALRDLADLFSSVEEFDDVGGSNVRGVSDDNGNRVGGWDVVEVFPADEVAG